MRKRAKAAMDERVAGYERLNQLGFYMVTFDLKPSKGRTAVYAAFKSHLERLMGKDNTHRIIKQCYFVKSPYHMRDVRKEMQFSLEDGDSILVARLRPGPSYSLKVPGARKRAKQYFSELKEEEEEL